MIKPIALGEEVWIRRDLEGRGGSFFIREFFTLYFQCVNPIIFLALIFYCTTTVQRSMPHIGMIFLLFIPYGILQIPLVYIGLKYAIKTSSRCPILLYAEQLNPETLTIHRLGKQPTQLQLAESTLQERTFLKHYTTITLTDKDNNSATLPALTPEEHHRFMAYWNAANPPTNAPRIDHQCPK